MSFLKKMFPEKDQTQFIEDFLNNLFTSCGFSLHVDIEQKEKGTYHIDLFGGDEKLLVDHQGELLKAFQTYIGRTLRNKMKDQLEKDRIFVKVDSLGFLEKYEKDLLDLAYKLKKEALKKKKPMFLKHDMNSFQRRQIHQMLTEDGKVETRSIGEGAFKKIKISPLLGNKSDGSKT